MSGVVAPPARAFIGRSAELADLKGQLSRAMAGRGGLVMIGGEPGAGKSRLLEEFAAVASRHDVAIAWGRCWEAGAAPPFWPWVQVLRAQLRAVDPVPLLQRLGPHGAVVAMLLPELSAAGVVPEPGDPPVESGHRRFLLFDAMAAWMRALAAERPQLVLLDDLHAVDRPSIRFLTFLAREVRDNRVLIVGAHREAEVRITPDAADALIEAAREGSMMELAGLSERDVARFVETRTGARLAEPAQVALHRYTGGNPSFLEEVVAALPDGATLPPPGVRWPVPPRVHDAVETRLQTLSPACRELLELVAACDGGCSLQRLALVAGITPAAATTALDEAVIEGLVSLGGPTAGVEFRHGVVREVLWHDLDHARRSAVHGRIGAVLERQPDIAPFEVARHLLEAADGGGDPGRALGWARRAVANATDRLAHEEAAAMCERILRMLDMREIADPVVRAAVLLDLGDARQRAGDADGARRAYQAARTSSRDTDDPGPLLARAALGIAGIGGMAGRADEAVVGVLEEALAALGPGDQPWRARVLGRLATELPYDPEDTRRDELSLGAVIMAERLGDPALFCEALTRRHAVLMAPGSAPERAAIVSAILELARINGDAAVAAEGRAWRVLARLELGDIAGVDRDIRAMSRLAEASRHPHHRWLTALFRAMRALLAARFDDAERLAHEALAVGRRHGYPDALAAYGAQLYVIRWGQGQLAELAQTIDAAASREDTPAITEGAMVHFLALTGRTEQARRRFAAACDVLVASPKDATWLAHLVLLGEACAVLEERDRAGALADLLAPYVDRVVVAGPAAVCLGPAARVAGSLAGLIGRHDVAIGLLVRAEALAERLGAGAWLAEAHIDLGAAHFARDAAGDRAAARARVAMARTLADRLGLRGVEERVRALEARLGDVSPPERRQARQVLRREGDDWYVEFDGRTCRLRDSKGVRILAELLRHPGRPTAAVDLSDLADGRPPRRDPMAWTAAQAERRRVSVARAVRTVLARLAISHPALGDHLKHTVRLGTLCTYAPDSRAPIAWEG